MSSIKFPDSTSSPAITNAAQPSLHPDLEKMGVQFERWDVRDVDLTGVDLKNPTEGLVEQILAGHKGHVKVVYDFRTPEGYIDLVKLSPETPGLKELLVKFDAIHDHDTPEIRLILDGEGTFNVYTDAGVKYVLPVDRGCFFVIPRHSVHNFQLTDTHTITALRVFQNKAGWVSNPRKVGVPRE